MAPSPRGRQPRPSASARARAIRCLIMDVDGVLTDGRMTLTERGDELKTFNTRDGIAVALARRAGLRTAIVTGERTTIAKVRGEKLGVEKIVLGARRKGETVDAILEEFGLVAKEAAFVGDDLLDLPGLERVGLAIAVADAAPEVKAVAHLVTRARGGGGAVREVVEFVLRAQGVWTATVHGYVRDHGGRPERWR